MIPDKKTILERLRAETRDNHDRLEEVAASDKLAGGSLSAEEYKRLLEANYAAHRRLEGLVADAPGMAQLVQERQKMGLLEQDLLQAGLEPERVWQQIHEKLPSVRLNTRHKALGAQYVMEGATLGGVVILKALNQHSQLQEFQPFHYYGCYGADTGKRWSSFKHLLQEEAQSPEEEEQVLEGAKLAYQLFEKAFIAVQM